MERWVIHVVTTYWMEINLNSRLHLSFMSCQPSNKFINSHKPDQGHSYRSTHYLYSRTTLNCRTHGHPGLANSQSIILAVKYYIIQLCLDSYMNYQSKLTIPLQSVVKIHRLVQLSVKIDNSSPKCSCSSRMKSLLKIFSSPEPSQVKSTRPVTCRLWHTLACIIVYQIYF